MPWDRIIEWKIGENTVEERIPRKEVLLDNSGARIEKDKPLPVTVTDYIYEAHAARLIYDFQQWREGGNRDNTYGWNQRTSEERLSAYFSRVIDNELKMQIAIDVARMDIENIDAEDSRRYFPVQKEDAEKLCQLIDSTKTYIDSFDPNVETGQRADSQHIIDLLADLKQNFRLFKLTDIFEAIEHWVIRLSSLSGFTEHEVSVYRDDLYNLFDRIPNELCRESRERYIVLKRVWKRYYRNNADELIEFLMISISVDRFEQRYEDIQEHIAKDIQSVQDTSITFDDIVNERKENILKDIETFLKNQKGQSLYKKIREKYTDRGGCFGILITPNCSFFSLSGRDDYDGTAWKGTLILDSKIKEAAEKINDEFFDGNFIWAKLSDETLRYTEILRNHDDPVNLIKSAISLGDPANSHIIDPNHIGLTYGCCERKMQAANGHDFVSDKEYFARWAPCEKCVPAVAKEQGKIRIFARAENFGEYKMAKKNGEELPIHEYEIKSAIRRIR